MPVERSGARSWACGAGLILAAALTVASGRAAEAADRKPVVVELFTSQGCSSCPPANANLVALSDRPGIIALSFDVTYWDRLGWKDTFGRKDYTARQAVYEVPLGEPGPFTPQIVVGGRASITGDELPAIEQLVARDAATSYATSVALGPRSVSIEAGAAPRDGADVWLVSYDPRRVDVPVRRGENGGRTLPHKNVVHDLTLIGQWTGGALTLPLPAATPGLLSAILVQAKRGGPILAAASN